jgi:hypothetical protein
MRALTLLAIAGGGFVALTFVDAQSQTPRPPSAVPLDTQQCQRGASPTPGETNGSATLSDQLAQSKGVICPPAGIDPGIAAPLVGGGRTPVIPPPGTPGGDPSIIPK